MAASHVEYSTGLTHLRLIDIGDHQIEKIVLLAGFLWRHMIEAHECLNEFCICWKDFYLSADVLVPIVVE
jgi:hypothetical protein